MFPVDLKIEKNSRIVTIFEEYTEYYFDLKKPEKLNFPIFISLFIFLTLFLYFTKYTESN